MWNIASIIAFMLQVLQNTNIQQAKHWAVICSYNDDDDDDNNNNKREQHPEPGHSLMSTTTFAL